MGKWGGCRRSRMTAIGECEFRETGLFLRAWVLFLRGVAFLGKEPAAELFLKGVGQGVSGCHQHTPTPASGIDGDFPRGLHLAHPAVFIQDPDGKINLLLRFGSLKPRRNRQRPEAGAALAGIGRGNVDQEALITVGECLPDGREVGQVGSLAAMVGALEFARHLVG